MLDEETKRLITMMALLLEEAAVDLREVSEAEHDRIGIRFYLVDEMQGAVYMANDILGVPNASN